MLVSDIPQMRQSEGNKTAKRFSPTWLAQVRGLCKTIEVPASGTVARLARILSSLLLKTASNYAARVSIAVRENTHVRTALHMQYSGVPCR